MPVPRTPLDDLITMPHTVCPPPLATRLAALACLLLAPLALAQAQTGQRDAFRQAYEAARQGDPHWQHLAQGLEDYPLFPYLQAAALQHHLKRANPEEIKAYLARYPDLIPAEDLRRDYLLAQAQQQDWPHFLALYQPGMGARLQCDALRARLAQGQTLDFQRDLAELWKSPSLPNSCDPVQVWAHTQGLLTKQRLWDRIDAAAEAGRSGTIASLARWLPDEDALTARHLAQGIADPRAAMTAATHWSDTPHDRAAVVLGMERLARKDSAAADDAWSRLQDRFKLDTQQRGRILAALALYRATDFSDDALRRLAALPPSAQTDATREWRVRVALARQHWADALKGIDALSSQQREDDEWRYWRARVIGKLHGEAAARPLFRSLAGSANYYGFLAADETGAPYAICPLELAGDAAQEKRLLALPGLERAFEFYALDMPVPARREYNRATRDLDQREQRLAADLSYRRGWWDRAIFAFGSGENMRLYTQRFPLARKNRVVHESHESGIDPAWAYGIIRAESAWMADAHSGADARGLMQLLPSTAARVARLDDLDYAGPGDLYNPQINIALGTRYLSRMAARFNGAPWLASAAYNAGPGAVQRWLRARAQLSPDVFVATIPYHETRDYVARVMAFSVIYDWRLNHRVLAMSSRMPPIGSTYAPPAADSPRKAVVCPTRDAETAAVDARASARMR